MTKNLTETTKSKVCTSCEIDKPLMEFNKHKRMKDGLQSICKVCKRAKDKIYREQNSDLVAAGKAKCYQAKKEHYSKKSRDWAIANPEGRKKIVNTYYENNRDFVLEKQAQYRAENREVCAERIKDWESRNPDRVRAKCSRRRAAKLNAQPIWLTKEQKEQIVMVYAHAKDCEVVSGERYHVDHIVPLQGKNICGLHVPWNLQVLPADINLSKSNKYEPEPKTYSANT